MYKTASKVDANVELARTFADIWRASTHEDGAVLRAEAKQSLEALLNKISTHRQPWAEGSKI